MELVRRMLAGDTQALARLITLVEEESAEVPDILEADSQGTRVDLSHSNLPNDQSFRDHSQGWKTYFLEPLTQHLGNRLELLDVLHQRLG